MPRFSNSIFFVVIFPYCLAIVPHLLLKPILLNHSGYLTDLSVFETIYTDLILPILIALVHGFQIKKKAITIFI